MSYASEVLADSPVVYYRMNEASGQPQDSSGNGLHTTGTLGSPTYGQAGAIPSDQANGAILFSSATAMRFTTPDDPLLDPGDVFTLECWYKGTAGTGAHQTFFDKGSGGYQLLRRSENVFGMSRQDLAILVTSNLSPVDGVWYHVVGTKNGATSKLYVNGVDVSLPNTNSTVAATTSQLSIGTNYDGTTQRVNGVLDEIAIYATALSAGRVLAHYNAAFSGSPPRFRRRSRGGAW